LGSGQAWRRKRLRAAPAQLTVRAVGSESVSFEVMRRVDAALPIEPDLQHVDVTMCPNPLVYKVILPECHAREVPGVTYLSGM
jgi:hypothetical protein